MSTDIRVDPAVPAGSTRTLSERRPLGDRGFSILTLASGLLVLVILVLIAVTISQQASSWFSSEGFKVFTNTTVYKETDMNEVEELFEYLKQFDVDGHQIAPAYGYSSVNDREIFLTRDDVHEKFKDITRIAAKYNVRQTPLYLDFLKGEHDFPCTAWGNPTYNVKGWKGPCYLITDGHYRTFEELMTRTPWESYGKGNDPRCEHCMVHCGYEPSAALGINAGIADNLKMLKWSLS